MVKDHSDSEKGNPLPPIGYSFRLTARVLLYAPSHRQDSTYHSLCYTSRVIKLRQLTMITVKAVYTQLHTMLPHFKAIPGTVL